jgi:hypothetical protein
MSYPPALSDLTPAPQSCKRFVPSDRMAGVISSGQQCGELIGTSKTLNPRRPRSHIASIAVADQMYENVLMIIWRELPRHPLALQSLGTSDLKEAGDMS